MCKLIIVTKKKGYSHGVDACVGSQYGTIYNEPHGYGALALANGKASQFVALARDKYAGQYVDTINALRESTFAMIHSRYATTGAQTEDNIHSKEQDRGRHIAHNGIVSKFSGWSGYQGVSGGKLTPAKQIDNISINKAKKQIRKYSYAIEQCEVCDGMEWPCAQHMNDAIAHDFLVETVASRQSVQSKLALNEPAQRIPQEKTDSFQFLQALPDTLNADVLAKAMKTYGFSGIACIYDSITCKAWLLATRTVYAHTDGDYAVMYSFMPTDPRETLEVAGIPMVASKPTTLAEIGAGVYEITL